MAEAQRARTNAATSSLLAPSRAANAPDVTAIAIAAPMTRESTTVTGTSACSAAICAEPRVLDNSADRWTETMEVAPAATAAAYASVKAWGAGRDVDTGVNTRSAAATSSGVTSTPSWNSWPPMTTCKGTTPMP